MTWLWFVLCAVVAYTALSLMGQLSGGAATTPLAAALNLFKPYALLALVVGNMLWAVALYYGLRETKLAIPALIAVGVLTSFAYSVLFLGGQVTLFKAAGLALVLAGIFLLAL